MNISLSAVFSQGVWNSLSICKVLEASLHPVVVAPAFSEHLSTPKHWSQLCAATRPSAGTQGDSVKVHQLKHIKPVFLLIFFFF